MIVNLAYLTSEYSDINDGECYTMYHYNRNICYSVNGHHHYRIPVRANVVEMSVSLSTNVLTLTEPLISPVNFGKACIKIS